tara:strand:- start:183 stop:833 length:651 start_codon:yes stop_codon:yes gene_type:complete
MNKNLTKRVFTSIILSIILFSCLFFHKYSWLLLLIIASIISFFEFNNLTKKIWKRKKISIGFANLISIFYLIFFIYSAYDFIRTDIIIVLLVCIFSDIGGFIVGRSIGGKKLTKISPNKTISGSIGSFVFALIPIIYFFYYDIVHDYTPNYWILISFVLIVSLICQAGDIFISYFKRKAKVKDTGTILPGHGGILDRIDGIIFAIPGAFILDKYIF